jgi:hypothetical protein
VRRGGRGVLPEAGDAAGSSRSKGARRTASLVTFGTGSKRKPGGVIELPYLDGVQHAAFPDPVEIYDWLSWSPAYTSPHRSSTVPALGAHAFMPEDGDGNGSISLCGYAPRAKAGRHAPRDARRCIWCERVIRGVSRRFGGRR